MKVILLKMYSCLPWRPSWRLPYLLSLCFIPSLFTVVSVFCCVFHSLSNIVSVCCCVFHSVSNTVSVLCCGFHSLSNNYCLYLLLCVSFPLYEYLPPSFFVCFIPLCNVFVSSLNRPCLSLRSPGSFHLWFQCARRENRPTEASQTAVICELVTR